MSLPTVLRAAQSWARTLQDALNFSGSQDARNVSVLLEIRLQPFWVPYSGLCSAEGSEGVLRFEQLSCALRGFLHGSAVKIRLPMQDTWVQSLGQKDPLEKEMATHSSILAWEIPWTEEPGWP